MNKDKTQSNKNLIDNETKQEMLAELTAAIESEK